MSEQHSEQERRNQAVFDALARQAPLPPPPADAIFAPAAAPALETGERPGLPLAGWVVIDAVLAFILTLVLTLIATGIFAAAKGLTGQDQLKELIKDPYFFFLSVALQSVAFVLIVLLRIVVLRRLPLTWLGVHNQRLLGALGWGAVAGVAFLVANVALGAVFKILGSEPDQAAQFPTTGANSLQLGLLGIAIAVFAPLVEELFFRGYALRAFSQRLGPRWGLVLSAALFAGPHVLGITTGFIGLLVPIFIGGLILGAVYQRTGSLWSPIVAHAMNNGVAFLALLAEPYLPK